MESGPGKGPGLNGPGSQNAGGTSTGDAAPGSGSATGKPNAAGMTRMGSGDWAPLYMSGVVFVCTLLGALAL